MLREIPLRDLDRLIIGESVHFTTPALAAVLRGGIAVQVFSWSGSLLGSFLPAQKHHGLARLRPYQRTLDPAFALQLAGRIITAKLYNQRRVLQRLAASRKEFLNSDLRFLIRFAAGWPVLNARAPVRRQLQVGSGSGVKSLGCRSEFELARAEMVVQNCAPKGTRGLSVAMARQPGRDLDCFPASGGQMVWRPQKPGNKEPKGNGEARTHHQASQGVLGATRPVLLRREDLAHRRAFPWPG